MNLPDRRVLIGMTLGAVCATAIAAIGPGMVIEAFADDSIVGVDASRLVKYEDREYLVDYDASVATDALSTNRIKKVEGGRVSYVTITSTATGTYSTDAMFSSHVQYPGIEVKPVDAKRNRFSYWSNGRWSAFVTRSANSFIYSRAWRN